MSAGGTTHVELLEASGPWWSPLLAVLLIALFLLGIWVLMHPVMTSQWLRLVWRRGRAYRKRMRAARHRRRRDSLHHLTYRSPVR